MTGTDALLRDLADRYDPALRARQLSDLRRQNWHVEMVKRLVPPGGSMIDLGSGVGMFSLACAALGFSTTIVDDFSDPVNVSGGDQLLDMHRAAGVNIVQRDLIAEGIDFPCDTADLIMALEAMEHWHHSPKRLFAQVREVLKPGGWFVVAVPNCVSIRRRITVPLGKGKWSTMRDWYEEPVFRGHVREADISDLRYIAQDMHMVNVRIVGCNWRIYAKSPKVQIAALLDRVLKPFPSLCTDIYMFAQRPLTGVT